jgi:hypothetical protein
MIDYSLILTLQYPNYQWSLEGYEYDGLTWLNDSPKPTQAELDALWESTLEQAEAEKTQAITAKESALAKLAALGLTQDEVKSILGTA